MMDSAKLKVATIFNYSHVPSSASRNAEKEGYQDSEKETDEESEEETDEDAENESDENVRQDWENETFEEIVDRNYSNSNTKSLSQRILIQFANHLGDAIVEHLT